MRRSTRVLIAVATAAALSSITALALVAPAQTASAQAASAKPYRDIEKTLVRHWSTVLNGMQVDYATFKRETDTVLTLAAQQAKSAGKTQQARSVTSTRRCGRA